MRVPDIKLSNLINKHNVIVYGSSKEQLENFYKKSLKMENPPICISDHNVAVPNNKEGIECVYDKLNKSKCRTWVEYNEKHQEDKIPLMVVSYYGTAKEIAKLPNIQECLAKAWAAGYRFIFGVTDGNDKKLLKTVNDHCECHIELSQK